MKQTRPSLDQWIEEAKQDPSSQKCGMYLFHNGTVRNTPKAIVRDLPDAKEAAGLEVVGMEFSCDWEKVQKARQKTLSMPGIYYVRIWLNKGHLETGDDIMLVLIGGDIRPHVVDGLQALVGEIKNHCVTETEIFKEVKD